MSQVAGRYHGLIAMSTYPLTERWLGNRGAVELLKLSNCRIAESAGSRNTVEPIDGVADERL